MCLWEAFFEVIECCSRFESKRTLEVTAEQSFESQCVSRENCQNSLEYQIYLR